MKNRLQMPGLNDRIREIERNRDRTIRKIKRAYKIGRAIRKFRKYAPLSALVVLVWGLSAWYCISLGTIATIITGVCLLAGLIAFLVISAPDLI